MQACQVCGTADVDAGGHCTGCGNYRGTQSYAVSAPGVYGEPAYAAAGSYAVAAPGAPVSPAVPQYPVSPATAAAEPYYAPYEGDVIEGAPERPARGLWATPLFLLTVMVVVLVAGAVSVVLIKTSDRRDNPANAAAPTSAPPSASASPSASAVVDRCMVGDWAVTSLTTKSEVAEFSTASGGIFNLRADGTGTWDLGSGITLTGTIDDVKSTDLVSGRMDFKYRTVGQSFTFQDVKSDVREVFTKGRNKPVNQQAGFLLSVAEYTCAGDAARLKWAGYDLQMGRK